MTQVFDPDTGAVTSVTVIEAGPCPVVQVKTVETDGYDAVQLAFDAVPERKLTRPELGHLKRFGVGPHRKLVEFRGAIDGAVEGETRHGRELRAGRRGQGRRHRDRQGLPGHDQAAQLLERPAVARLAQHPQAGLDRRLGHAVACLQGHEDGRPHGRQARDPGRADRARGRPRAEPAARQGLGSGPEERASSRCGADGRPTAPLLDAAGAKTKDVDARGRRVRRRGQAAPRPRGRARRAQRAPRGHVRDEEPRARLRRPRQAVAPEGHRPRAPGHDPRAAVRGRRPRLREGAAHVRPEGQPQGGEGRAALGAREPRRRPARSRWSTRRVRGAVDEGREGASSRPRASRRRSCSSSTTTRRTRPSRSATSSASRSSRRPSSR